MASSASVALPDDAVAEFVIDETPLPACTKIRWGGGGVVDAPAADALPADGQIWPSPPPALCTTGATFGGDDMAGVPSCNDVSIVSPVDPKCFVLWGKLVCRRVYVLYGTTISESNLQN